MTSKRNTHSQAHVPSRISPWLSAAALALGTAGPIGCASSESELDSSNSLTIGLLLPFTGANAATGANFERAVIYAVDRVNDSGGLRGKPVRVVSRDTHSTLKRSKQSVRELIEEDAVVVLGPESPEIAASIIDTLSDADVAFMSPLIGAGYEVDVDCEHPWFRLAQSAQSLGEATAKLLYSDEVSEISILYGQGDYNEAFRESLRERFLTLGGTVARDIALPSNTQSFSKQLKEVFSAGVEQIVLATSPQMGAIVVNEAAVLSRGKLKWYLSPLLKTDLFLQNVRAESLEGARGTAPAIFETGDAFPLAFGERWRGDRPLEGAFFYYDAIGLISFALESAENLEYANVEAALKASAAPPGEPVEWDEIEEGLQRIRDGNDMYYSGLTGPMVLTRCGPRQLGKTGSWRVQSGKIVDDEIE